MEPMFVPPMFNCPSWELTAGTDVPAVQSAMPQVLAVLFVVLRWDDRSPELATRLCRRALSLRRRSTTVSSLRAPDQDEIAVDPIRTLAHSCHRLSTLKPYRRFLSQTARARGLQQRSFRSRSELNVVTINVLTVWPGLCCYFRKSARGVLLQKPYKDTGMGMIPCGGRRFSGMQRVTIMPSALLNPSTLYRVSCTSTRVAAARAKALCGTERPKSYHRSRKTPRRILQTPKAAELIPGLSGLSAGYELEVSYAIYCTYSVCGVPVSSHG
jgi:hypothetical protein